MPDKSKRPVERAQLLKRLRDFEEHWRAFEHGLREEEAEIWQAHWSYSDPLAERLLRVGYPRETIGALKKHLEIIYQALRGEPLTPDTRRELDEMDAAERAAEKSAIKQPGAIVIAGVSRGKPLQSPRHEYGAETACTSKLSLSLAYVRFVG